MNAVRILTALALALALAACAAPPPADPPNLADAKENLNRGGYWYGRGCYREAARFFGDGLKAARLSDDVPLIVRAQNSLGAVSLARGEAAAAAGYLEQAADIALSRPDRPDLDRILGNFGALAYQAGRSEEAEEFWLEAVQTAAERGENPTVYLCNLARLYLDGGREADFLAMSAKALAAAGPSAGPAARADALNLAGRAALTRGDDRAAEDFFSQALALDRQTENAGGLAQDAEALGLLMLRRQEPRAAAGYLDRAFFLRLYLNDLTSARRILKALEELKRTSGFPARLEAYQSALRNPSAYRLDDACP